MSTYPRNRARPRRAYDPSPSPSPTLVASCSPTDSTVSLPRHNTAGPGHGYGPGQAYGSSPDHRKKLEDSVAKFSIFVGIMTVLAGVMHLRKSKKNRQLGRQREDYEKAQRRDRRRRDRAQDARQRGNQEWDDWRERSARHRIGERDGGGMGRIEYPMERGDRGRRYDY